MENNRHVSQQATQSERPHAHRQTPQWNTVVEGRGDNPLPGYRAADPLSTKISHPGRGGSGYPVTFSYVYYYNTHTAEIDAFFFLLEYISLPSTTSTTLCKQYVEALRLVGTR